MENWQTIALCYFLALFLIGIFFGVKAFCVTTLSPKKRLQRQMKCFSGFLKTAVVLFAVWAVHLSYLCGDLNLCVPVMPLLAIAFMLACIIRS